MTDSELESLYWEMCRALSEVGEDRASLFLARFALLVSNELQDCERVRALLAQARETSQADAR